MRTDDAKTCATALEWIEASARGELDAERSERLEAHLAGCAACRRVASDVRHVREVLSGVTAPRCPDRVVSRIFETIDASAEVQGVERPGGGVAERFAAWLAKATWRPVVATAAALLAIVLFTGRDHGRTPDTTLAPVDGAATEEIFCEKDIDALLARMDLGGIEETKARQAAEEACLAFAILARAMSHAAGVAETELIESLEAPLRRGVGSGVDHLPAPLQRPERAPLDKRG